MKDKILLIEDDKSIQRFLRISLETKDYKVISAETGIEGISLYMTDNPDLILLDLGLPDIDGMEVLSQIRAQSEVAILVVSARGQEQEKVEALDHGADDYITKPFRPLVLGAKVKALIRRNKNLVLDNSDTLECGPFSYDTTTMRFYKNGEELILSSKESALLLLFMKHPQQVFTKDMIYEHVWGNTVAVDDNAIMVYINRLRGKIEDDRQNPAYILTIRGLGYRFVP